MQLVKQGETRKRSTLEESGSARMTDPEENKAKRAKVEPVAQM